MNSVERKILKKAADAERLTETEKNFVEFLAEKDPAFRLKADYRIRLYAIGTKLGIDGGKEFAKAVKAQ